MDAQKLQKKMVALGYQGTAVGWTNLGEGVGCFEFDKPDQGEWVPAIRIGNLAMPVDDGTPDPVDDRTARRLWIYVANFLRGNGSANLQPYEQMLFNDGAPGGMRTCIDSAIAQRLASL